MRTKVTDMLGVEFPILAFSHCRDVVAAVTRAGGFGVLGAVAHTPEQLDVDLTLDRGADQGRALRGRPPPPRQVRRGRRGWASTPRPCGSCSPPPNRSSSTRSCAATSVPELPEDLRTGSQRNVLANVASKGYEPLLDVAFAHDIALMASALGPATARAASRGPMTPGWSVAALAGTLTHAERHHAAGVDVIVAQGTEAGGHTGEISTMVLVPEVVDAVAPTPVLAAGGIGNGRQIAAALALGAEGVWCGSVWLTTEEAETHPGGEAEVPGRHLAATPSGRARSRASPPACCAAAWTDEWEGAESPGALPMPLQSALVAEAQHRISRRRRHRRVGSAQAGQLLRGPGGGPARPHPARPPGRPRHDDRVRRGGPALRRPGRRGVLRLAARTGSSRPTGADGVNSTGSDSNPTMKFDTRRGWSSSPARWMSGRRSRMRSTMPAISARARR